MGLRALATGGVYVCGGITPRVRGVPVCVCVLCVCVVCVSRACVAVPCRAQRNTVCHGCVCEARRFTAVRSSPPRSLFHHPPRSRR